ncbi:hypothetical protein HK102_001385, partial [Quaeritorhiza haematococci]
MTPGFQTVYRPKVGGVRFVKLLEECSRIAPEVRFRFTSPHLKDFPPDLLQLIRDRPNICSQLHLPLQSGSTTVLERMRRGYSKESFVDLAERARAVIPGVSLSTDVIAGFCGETEEEHRDTLEVMEKVAFEMAFMFAYSARDKTPAMRRYKDDVPEDVKKRRLAEIIQSFKKGATAKMKSMVGSIQLVLVEGPSKRNEAMLTGRTDGNHVCVFDRNIPIADGLSGLCKRELERLSIGSMDGNTSESQIGVHARQGDFVAVRITDATVATLYGGPLARTHIQEFDSVFGESGTLGLTWLETRTMLVPNKKNPTRIISIGAIHLYMECHLCARTPVASPFQDGRKKLSFSLNDVVVFEIEEEEEFGRIEIIKKGKDGESEISLRWFFDQKGVDEAFKKLKTKPKIEMHELISTNKNIKVNAEDVLRKVDVRTAEEFVKIRAPFNEIYFYAGRMLNMNNRNIILETAYGQSPAKAALTINNEKLAVATTASGGRQNRRQVQRKTTSKTQTISDEEEEEDDKENQPMPTPRVTRRSAAPQTPKAFEGEEANYKITNTENEVRWAPGFGSEEWEEEETTKETESEVEDESAEETGESENEDGDEEDEETTTKPRSRGKRQPPKSKTPKRKPAARQASVRKSGRKRNV